MLLTNKDQGRRFVCFGFCFADVVGKKKKTKWKLIVVVFVVVVVVAEKEKTTCHSYLQQKFDSFVRIVEEGYQVFVEESDEVCCCFVVEKMRKVLTLN